MIVALYLIAAACEISGIGFVVFDVWTDRKHARELVAADSRTYVPRPPGPRAWIYEQIEESSIRRDPNSAHAQMIIRQRKEKQEREIQQIAIGSAQAEAELLEALADMLRGNLFRRLLGPALLVVGVVVGTVGNIAASG
jgi:hypothetical protein